MQWLQERQRAQKLEKENKELRKQLKEAKARIKELEYELNFNAPTLTNDPEGDLLRMIESPFYPDWYPRQVQTFRDMSHLSDAELLRLLNVDEEPSLPRSGRLRSR